MAHVADTTPYAWPWDSCADRSRLALVVCGADTTWKERTAVAAADRAGPDGAQEEIESIARAARRAGVSVVWLSHGSAGGRPATPDGPDDALPAMGVDGFYGSALDAVLRHRGITHLILCGWGLEATVHSTMRSANDRGYECLLVADASASLDERLRSAAISTVEMSGGIFGAVGDSDAVLDYFAALDDQHGDRSDHDPGGAP